MKVVTGFCVAAADDDDDDDLMGADEMELLLRNLLLPRLRPRALVLLADVEAFVAFSYASSKSSFPLFLLLLKKLDDCDCFSSSSSAWCLLGQSDKKCLLVN